MGNNGFEGKVLDYLLNHWHVSDEPVTESMLAEHFNVSPTPVRETLNNLEGKGLVERRQKKGTYLRPLSLGELSEVYDIRSALEGLAAKLLCEHVTENLIRELILMNEDYEMKKSSGNYLVLSKADSNFHSKIFESCGNQRLA